jgi:hypothetical protein
MTPAVKKGNGLKIGCNASLDCCGKFGITSRAVFE